MNTAPFIIERTFNTPAHKVWNAITNKDEMKEWYFNLEEFRPEKGFEFRFEGGDDKNTFLHICRITEVIPGKKLSHTWKYEGQPEETFVTWELFDEGENTSVKLTHDGLDKIAHHGPAFSTNNFEQGWTAIVGTSLKNYLENKYDQH